MLKARKWVAFVLVLLLVALVSVGALADEGKSDVIGVVFIDDNLNGVWDVGEAGYGGEWQYDDVQETERYVGAIVTVTTPSYEEFHIETAAYREPDEGDEVACSQQDMLVDDELNPNPVRPCAGTWGLNRVVNDTFLTISFVSPEGYYGTSENPQIFHTGTDTGYVDFGIAPLAAAGTGGPIADEALVDKGVIVEEEAPVAETWTMTVTGLGVPGLVFIDDNLDGIWQPGEAGYGGELVWNEDSGMNEYVGAEIMLISPAYDEVELTSGAWRELEEGETNFCTPQDLFIDGELNPHSVRPCSGAWGMPSTIEDVRWEVWVTAPEGYYVTSENPQYYTTGTEQMPLDFGIAPLAEAES